MYGDILDFMDARKLATQQYSLVPPVGSVFTLLPYNPNRVFFMVTSGFDAAAQIFYGFGIQPDTSIFPTLNQLFNVPFSLLLHGGFVHGPIFAINATSNPGHLVVIESSRIDKHAFTEIGSESVASRADSRGQANVGGR